MCLLYSKSNGELMPIAIQLHQVKCHCHFCEISCILIPNTEVIFQGLLLSERFSNHSRFEMFSMHKESCCSKSKVHIIYLPSPPV